MSPRTDADLRRTAAYYDRTAVDYDGQVDGSESNRSLRAAFRARVSALAGPGGTILDFGCGTGIDAAWYVGHGHRVIAYDISVGMLDVLRARCAAALASGRVITVSGGLDDLVRALASLAPIDAIAANFAVLNHFADLRPLFGALAPQLRPGGALAASLLTPLYRSDLRRPGWWRLVALSMLTGRVTNRGMVTVHRYFVRAIRRMARGSFDLAEVAWMDADGRWSSAQRGWRDARGEEFYFVVLRRPT
jgi:SAM-dependent methyltransferase